MHALMLALVATTVLTGVPDPGAGEAFPGSEAALTVLGWVAWSAFGICVLGAIIAGALMAIGSRRGDGGEHLGRLGWVFGGCIVVGSASSLVGALV